MYKSNNRAIKSYSTRLLKLVIVLLALVIVYLILRPFLFDTGAPNQDLILPSGDWGDLRISYIQIAPPLEFVAEYRKIYKSNDWHFPDWNASQLRDFLNKAPLSEPIRERLSNKIVDDPQTGGVCIFVENADVLSLRPEERAFIYNQLRLYSINAHSNVYKYASPSLSEWMRGVRLSAKTKDLISKLTYRNGNTLCFSDKALLIENIPTTQEQYEVIKALSREKTMLIKMRLSDDSDINSLAEYWGRGHRAKDVFPILDSLKRKPDDRYIDIVHLLPPFVRSRIYTYPDPGNISKDYSHQNDCHWTSFNFFNPNPEKGFDRDQPDEYLMEYFARNYEKVKPDKLLLGDILLYKHNDQMIHSAVYIAGDILFTKNGTNLSSPWMFMHMADMKDYYACNEGLEIVYLRAKDMDPQ